MPLPKVNEVLNKKTSLPKVKDVVKLPTVAETLKTKKAPNNIDPKFAKKHPTITKGLNFLAEGADKLTQLPGLSLLDRIMGQAARTVTMAGENERGYKPLTTTGSKVADTAADFIGPLAGFAMAPKLPGLPAGEALRAGEGLITGAESALGRSTGRLLPQTNTIKGMAQRGAVRGTLAGGTYGTAETLATGKPLKETVPQNVAGFVAGESLIGPLLSKAVNRGIPWRNIQRPAQLTPQVKPQTDFSVDPFGNVGKGGPREIAGYLPLPKTEPMKVTPKKFKPVDAEQKALAELQEGIETAQNLIKHRDVLAPYTVGSGTTIEQAFADIKTKTGIDLPQLVANLENAQKPFMETLGKKTERARLGRVAGVYPSPSLKIKAKPIEPDYASAIGKSEGLNRPVKLQGKPELPIPESPKLPIGTTTQPKAPIKGSKTGEVEIANLKDIGGFTARTQDVYRNFKSVFGNQFNKVKETLLDPFDTGKKANVDMQGQWLSKIKTEVVDKLGIRKGSKESALVQRFGEGRISEQELRAIAPDKANKIIEADKWFRKAYDELIDTVNKVRVEIYPNNPDKIIPKRKDYYRHFQELSGLEGLKNIFETPANIDPKLVGTSEFTLPKSKWLSFAQKRKGGMNFKEDAVGGFLNYIPSASYATHIDPHIGKFEKLASDLADATGESKHLNNFIEYLKEYSQDLAGKTPYLDRAIIKYVPGGRKSLSALNWLNSRTKANMVLGNLGSSLSQIANIPQGLAFAKQHSVKGVGKTLKAIFDPNAPINKSGFIAERYSGQGGKLYRQFDVGLLDKPKNFAVWMLETTDKIGTSFTWNSAYAKAVAEGAKNPIKFADDATRGLVAGRGIGEVPLLQKSKIFQLVAPFQLEVANLWHVQKDFVKAKDFGGLATLYLANFVFNKAMEEVRGSGVVFDPVDAMMDAFSEDDITPLQRGGRLAGEVLSNIPVGQTIASAYPEYGTKILPTRKELFGRNDPTRFGSGLLVAKAAQDPVSKLLLPYGGAQVKKTLGGLEALSKKGVYKDDKLKYPIETTATNKAKGVLFGPGALTETKEYYDKNRRPLSEQQTKAVEKSNNPKEQYETIQRKRRIDTIREQLRSLAKNKELTTIQKEKQRKVLLEKLEKARQK